MLEPKHIVYAIKQPDIIRNLILQRKLQLEAKYPSLEKNFNQLQAQLHEHVKQLKASPSTLANEELFKRIVDELELKEYTIIPKENSKAQETSWKHNIVNKKQSTREKDETFETVPTNGSAGDCSHNPYHFTNFKKELHDLHAHYLPSQNNASSRVKAYIEASLPK